MRNILFIRHAKSSWEDLRLKDWERPLNSRGKKDAPKMADFMLEKVSGLDRIYPSIARRTQQTGRYFQQTFQVPEEYFIPVQSLYLEGMEMYLQQLWGLEEEVNNVALIGHNPTITHIANSVQPGLTDNVPTCGVIWVETDIDDWSDFDFQRVQLRGYYYPKILPK